ncbi:palmitoyltransferase PFA3 [Xylaria nigripes]|nr:palmitoyltransferase PFA3 [Xylaria nigripes]
MSRRWARRFERYCCGCITYFPLVFVYGLSTWALWVIINITSLPTLEKEKQKGGIGTGSPTGGFILYALVNWCYTTAVFTDPGGTTSNGGYSSLPTVAPPSVTPFTVKSSGARRYCQKCQAPKPDRTHHCSTCRRCVLKMDHHCPWLATCIGLGNHKAFLLFLIYTTLFCFYCFYVSGKWVHNELLAQTEYTNTIMPVNYILLAVISGIVSLVLGGFTGWHIMLASRGQTTIECLEKTVHYNPLRNQAQRHYVGQDSGDDMPQPKDGQQLLDTHANGPEDTQVLFYRDGRRTHATYEEMEYHRVRRQYEEYMDEEDAKKLPNAFDLGVKKNLLHLFGPQPLLWFFPIMNTTGNGWTWEPSPKWLEARERITSERAAQRQRERAAGWGDDLNIASNFPPRPPPGAGRHYMPSHVPASGRRIPLKAARILGRDPNIHVDEPDCSVSMKTLDENGRASKDEQDTASDRDEAQAMGAEHRAMNVVTNGAWARNGASGLLKPVSRTSRSTPPKVTTQEDEGVD